METTCTRTVLSFLLILSLNDVHVFCQNGISAGPLSATLPNNEARGPCPIPGPSFNRASSQLINSLQSQAAANGVSVDQLLAQVSVLPQNLLSSQSLPEGFGNQAVPLGGLCSKSSINPRVQQQPFSNNPILPCLNLPTPVSCNVTAQPTGLPSTMKPFFSQTLPPPPIYPAQNTFLSSCGTIQAQQCNQLSLLNGLTSNSIIAPEINKAVTNPIATISKPNFPMFCQQEFSNPLITCSSSPSAKNYLREANLWPTCFPSFPPPSQPCPLCIPQLNDNFKPPVVNDIDPSSITIQEIESTVISPNESIETAIVTNTINSETIDVQQAVVTTENSPQLPINLVINIPPVTVPSPIITLPSISSPSVPVLPPNVPSFGAYSQPIVLESSKSKLKSWLPLILLALLNNNGCGCGGCCSP